MAIEAHPKIHGYLEGNAELNRARNIETPSDALIGDRGEVAKTRHRFDDLGAVRPEVSAEVLQMLSAEGSFER